jgi:hypothetical protein
MDNIKTIGGAGGIFHIFVPGVFLLINFLGGVYLFPWSGDDTRKVLFDVFRSPALGLVITISFGYLLGVILRIFRSESADHLSAKYLRKFDKNTKKAKDEGNLYAYENFPYTKWIGQYCKKLPDDVQRFYMEVWSLKKTKEFFNFCKVLIISEDKRGANEIYAAESLCRYISGIFYALVVSFFLQIVILITVILINHNINVVLIGLLVGYCVAIIGILRNFRFMRLKEVQTVFAAAYKNRHLFKPDPNC